MQDLSQEKAREILVQSGEWQALRTRPFSRTPLPTAEASSIFVTAMDTNPLAPEAELIISNHKEAFLFGLGVVSLINNGSVFVCTRDDSRVPGKDVPGVQFESFAGPHPAGLAGTHIHMLDPVSVDHVVWTIGYQDVIAWGYLFLEWSTAHRTNRIGCRPGCCYSTVVPHPSRSGSESIDGWQHQ